MRPSRPPAGRLLPVALALAWLVLPGPAGAALTAAPNPPVWPVPDLVNDVRGLLVAYYNQEAAGGSTPYYYRAPEWETDKAAARKDPDTLWEYYGGPGTACHAATTGPQFVGCTGTRLARTFGLAYSGGLTLFNAGRGYYANDALAQMAGYYALYHAFARDFDAPAADYVPTTGRAPRDAQRYHERMIRAYEAHMRDTLVRMFRDTRADGQFQLDMTRSVGAVETNYVRIVEAMEEHDLWASPSDRRNALAVVNGLNQRLWWEWVWTQANGPRTAGFADLGSEATYAAGIAAAPGLAGTNRFFVDGAPIPSLRPAAQDAGGWGGLWFDADYAVPGEWWCYGRYGAGSPDRVACLAQASRESRDGTKSPFGQYYGPASPSPCDTRAGAVTPQSCAETNLGSIAEEWMWTFVGARAGMLLVKELAASGDPDTPAGAIGPNEADVVTARLGYGVSGWHGADPYHDDLEWTFGGGVQAIRTLSAGRHDFALQDGRYSLGEADVSGASTGRNGDTWGASPGEFQEYPGGIENHSPGPNPLYGTVLFAQVLDDRASVGLSPSLYDQFHRNLPDEFNSWIWLLQSIGSRCVGVPDPADDSCFAFSTAHWPNPAVVRRAPLYTRPDDVAVNLRFRYLWRDPILALQPSYVGARDLTCRGAGGLPWRNMQDWADNVNAGYLVDEGGYGAYNDLLQALGGTMRLLAARDPLPSADPSQAAEFAVQRADVLRPWYADAYNQVKAILALYRNPFPTGYGYVPDIENSTCVGFDPMIPGDRNNKMVLSWQVGTGDSVSATTVRRAMWYSIAAVWYAWYDSTWLDVDASVW